MAYFPRQIKCLSIDLDGTLLVRRFFFQTFIPQPTIDILRDYCSDKDNKIVISTGKCFLETWKIFKQLEQKGLSSNEIPFLICRNGASIWNTRDPSSYLENNFFNEEFCKKTIEILRERKLNYFFITSNGYVIHPLLFCSFLIYKFVFKSRANGRILRDVAPLDQIQKILIVVKLGKISSIKKILDRELGKDNYCLSQCCKFCWEIIDAKIDKYYALRKIAPKLGLEEDEIGAIGNEKNDLQSLKKLGVGVYINWKYAEDINPSRERIFINDSEGMGVSKGIREMKNKGFW